MEYMVRNESTYALWFARALSEHGWKVAESHPASESYAMSRESQREGGAEKRSAYCE